MRAWLNAILSFIGSSSLTDEEYNSMNFVNVTEQVYDQASYDELSKILAGRDQVSTMQSRLLGVFQAKGASITAAKVAGSQVFLGSVL